MHSSAAMSTLGLIKTGQGIGIECPVLPVPQIHVGWSVCVVINAGGGSGFNAGHVKPCVVSCFRSMSEKVLNDECARVCQSWHSGPEIVLK